jgi:hypothetical protein
LSSSPGAGLAAALNDFGFGKTKRGDKRGLAARKMPHGLEDGFVSRNANAPSVIQGNRPAGTRNALPGSKKNVLLDSVRKREPHVVYVRGIHLNLVQQLALPPRLFRAQQVALARMPPQHFSGRRNLEALGRASVRLQFHFLILLHNFLFRIFRLGRPR